jgi:hypothetical protein
VTERGLTKRELAAWVVILLVFGAPFLVIGWWLVASPPRLPVSTPLRPVFLASDLVCVGTVLRGDKGQVTVRVDEVLKGDLDVEQLDLDFDTYVDSSGGEHRTHFTDGGTLLLMLQDGFFGWRETWAPSGLLDVSHERQRPRITAVRELASIEGLPGDQRVASEVEWLVTWIERDGADATRDLCDLADRARDGPVLEAVALLAELDDDQLERLLDVIANPAEDPYWPAHIAWALWDRAGPRLDAIVRTRLERLATEETRSSRFISDTAAILKFMDTTVARSDGSAADTARLRDLAERFEATYRNYYGMSRDARTILCAKLLREFLGVLDEAALTIEVTPVESGR